MATPKKSATTNTVAGYIAQLDPPLEPLVEAIRKIILSTDKTIGEEIKWNSPSFYYTGEMKPFNPKEYKRDIVVLNLHRGTPLLVFPTGAKVNDSSGFLEGTYTDGRRIAKISDLADCAAKEKNLRKVLKAWLKMVEK